MKIAGSDHRTNVVVRGSNNVLLIYFVFYSLQVRSKATSAKVRRYFLSEVKWLNTVLLAFAHLMLSLKITLEWL